jgi:hypothetical protein
MTAFIQPITTQSVRNSGFSMFLKKLIWYDAYIKKETKQAEATSA